MTTRLGDYLLLRELGRGGQGVVHLGEDPSGVKVAVKVLHARFADEPGARERFLREVQTARRVAAFCTARVIEADLTGDQPYIVSEYVEGKSLAELVRADGPRDAGALARLAIGTMTALLAIHRAGIVHRDFKPSNVLLGPEGPVVIDFGIAKVLDATSTQSSAVVGTPSFMSPEQVAGEQVGPASDVFSWAVTLAFAATGRMLFGGDSIPAVLNRISHHEPDLTGVPEPLHGLLAACLAKQPADRPFPDQILLTLTGHGAAEQLTAGDPLTVDLRHAATLAYTRRLEERFAPPVTATEPTPPPTGPPAGAPGFRAPSTPPARIPGPTHPPASAFSARIAGAVAAALALAVAGTLVVNRAAGQDSSSTAAPASPIPAVATVTVTPSAAVTASAVPKPTPAPEPEDSTASSAPSPEQTTAPAPAPGEGITTWLAQSQGYDATAQIDGRTVAVSGGGDGWVTAWDPAKGTTIGEPVDCNGGGLNPITALSVAEISGHPAVLCTGSGHEIRAYDLRTGRRLVRPYRTTYGIRTLALTERGGRPAVVYGDGHSKKLKTFPLSDHEKVTELGITGESGDGGGYGPFQVITGTVGDRRVAVSAAGYDGVHVIALDTGALLVPPLDAASSDGKDHFEARSVALAERGGRTVVLSGWSDGTIRVFDPRTGHRIGTAITPHVTENDPGHNPDVTGLFPVKAGGRHLVASRDSQDGLHLWDLATGKPVRKE